MKKLIIDSANLFTTTSKLNSIINTDISFYDQPLVGFADALDPIFEEYKHVIGPFHLTPPEAFEMEYGKGSFRSGTVISVAMPISEAIRKSNRVQKEHASKEWTMLRTFGDEVFLPALIKHIITLLQQQGYMAFDPSQSENFKIYAPPNVGVASNWSERHIGYAAGLGSFSLNDGFITEKGMAVRLGSIVTNAKIDVDKRIVKNHTGNCLFLNEGKCGVCIKRCPAGAISKNGHDKQKCSAFTYSEEGRLRTIELGGEPKYGSGCGLCQTKVPCEFSNPYRR